MEHGTIHVDRVLSQIAFGYMNEMSVVEEVFPPLYVSRESDKFQKGTREGFRPERTGPRGFNEPATRAPFEIETDDYEMEVHSLYDEISDREQAHADSPLDLMAASVMNMTEKLRLEKEIAGADTVFNAARTYRTNLNAAKWDAKDAQGRSSNNPLTALNTGANAIRKRIGRMPNAIVMGFDVFLAMTTNTFLTERFINVREGRFDPVHLALYLNWLPPENIFVGGMVKDNAKLGQAFNGADVWGKSLSIFYRNEAQANDPMSRPTDVCFGRNFRWRMEIPVFSYRAQNPQGDGAVVMTGWDFKVIDEKAAVELYNVVD